VSAILEELGEGLKVYRDAYSKLLKGLRERLFWEACRFLRGAGLASLVSEGDFRLRLSEELERLDGYLAGRVRKALEEEIVNPMIERLRLEWTLAEIGFDEKGNAFRLVLDRSLGAEREELFGRVVRLLNQRGYGCEVSSHLHCITIRKGTRPVMRISAYKRPTLVVYEFSRYDERDRRLLDDLASILGLGRAMNSASTTA
jgi:hypothetical protein